MKKTLAAAIAVLALTGCSYSSTGETADGHYKVTDLDSHIQMCQEWTTEIERPACMDAAYATWGE